MIKQAIIPLAGLGTRLLPLTSVFAKELLPMHGKPNIEYILDECIEAGIKEAIFIISKNKLMIKKYFYNDKFFKNIIKKKKDSRIKDEYRKILKYKKMIKFVYQNKPLGTGDAVLKAQSLIKDNYFLMLLPDDLIIKKNCSKDMINSHNKHKASIMACMSVKKKTVSRWGIYNLGNKLNKSDTIINDVIEKPSLENAPSNKAVIGRYILPRKIFKIIPNLKSGAGGEIHITDAIRNLIYNGEKFIAHKFSGKYLDCGSMHGYIKSSIEISKL
ncbi:MAG: UTP--glucose-1-phosphate uridylyltransferase [Candidatus Pelagibacter sp. TMED118]|nr:MAG: UTP--glucose-1-phosphate uridylyltransferase [Candidatus Pelagibacter sp. TMED118]|tara:strand:- start:1628 stop:2443 length:816 start_codon:yes stop_codon:yes gene_type:complete